MWHFARIKAGDHMKKPKPTGRAIGAAARKKALNPQRRTDIAKKAAAARWSPTVKNATHGSEDHPLRIGPTEIACYVLEDETRVLTQRGLQTGIGMSTSGGTGGAHRLAQFVEGLAEKGVDCADLAVRIRNPILFRYNKAGKSAYGYEATILADICDAVLAARLKGGVLAPNQMRIAEQCEVLVRGFARVGIIALVDEATGYQKDRTRDALARILEAFIAKELQPWVRTFPAEYYQEMFRLRGLAYDASSVKRPPYFGHLTNDIVYDRLAPTVLDELKMRIPRNDGGKPKATFHQLLTRNVGYPKLREHLGAVVATMRLSSDWHDFHGKLDRNYPRYSGPTQIIFDFGDDADDGTGL
jgi:hypothetical protein